MKNEKKMTKWLHASPTVAIVKQDITNLRSYLVHSIPHKVDVALADIFTRPRNVGDRQDRTDQTEINNPFI